MVDIPSSNHSSRTAQRQSSGGVGNVSGQGITTPLPNNVVVSRPPLDVYKNLSIIFKSTDSVMYETFVTTTTTTTTDALSSGAVATSSSESQRNIPSLLSTKSLDDSSQTVVDPKSSQQHHGATSTTTTQLKCVPVAELGEVALKATPMTLQQQQANKAVTTKLNIPVPQIDPVQDYVTRNYRIPKSFVRHLKPFTSHHVRYTVDLEDEQWIKRHPLYEDNYDYTQDVKSSQLFSMARLTVSLFEDMINLLEEGTGFETIIRLDQAQALFATHLSSDGFKPSPSNKKVAIASQGTQQQSKLRGVSSSSSALQSSDATMILQQTSLQLTNDVYDYWISKRSKLRKPLLRTFWPTTATNDTNPHMVFRPREKEKYKLRKKRQNDMDTLRKLKVLRNDFDRLRQILELVSRREKVLSSVLSLRHDWFDQQRYDCTDTTGLQRHSYLSKKSEGNIIHQASPPFLHTSATASSFTAANLQLDQLNKLLEETSSTYDSTTKRGSHNKNNLKRKRSGGGGGASSSGRSTPVPSDSGNSTMSTATASTTADDGGGGVASGNTSKGGRRGGSTIRLGEDHGVYLTTPGDPNVVNAGVPNFVQPLKARQEYISSWDENVPFVESYSGGKVLSFTEFRHRGRIGRGGRICIDRIPGRTTNDDRPTTSTDFGSKASSTTVFEYAGHPPSYVPHHNLNVPTVFPVYMDADEKEAKRRRIEEIAAVDDEDANETDLDNNHIHVELVPMKDWLDTDDQKWGEETLALGPV